MSCLGSLHMVKQKQVERLKHSPREARADVLEDVLTYGETWYELAQSWDAMHRALTGGELSYGNDCPPGCWVILGGEVLHGDRAGEESRIITVKSPEQVRQAAQWLSGVTEETFRSWYFAIDPAQYGMEPDEDDFYFTWGYLEDSLEFWQTAAQKGWSVLFTASL